jgi:GTP-binding protein of the ras superfamily involved in termination of M-phase
MMPLVCSEAKVFIFVFDLTRKLSLSKIRDWYRLARKQNKYAIPFLIGAKFDLYAEKDMKFKEEITVQARKFSRAMNAPLIYCSSSHSINIKKIFQLILANVFHIKPKVEEMSKPSEPIVEYKTIWSRRTKKARKSNAEKKEIKE